MSKKNKVKAIMIECINSYADDEYFEDKNISKLMTELAEDKDAQDYDFFREQDEKLIAFCSELEKDFIFYFEGTETFGAVNPYIVSDFEGNIHLGFKSNFIPYYDETAEKKIKKNIEQSGAGDFMNITQDDLSYIHYRIQLKDDINEPVKIIKDFYEAATEVIYSLSKFRKYIKKYKDNFVPAENDDEDDDY